MTSLTYDDSIEIISYHTDDAPSGLGVSATASAASVDGTATATAYVSISGGGRRAAPDGRRSALAGRRRHRPGTEEGERASMSPQYRRMRCAVIAMASVMILASMLLVGVSLSMAEHIDELGRFSTSQLLALSKVFIYGLHTQILAKLGCSIAEWLCVLDSGTEGPGFKSQPQRCRVTVLGKLLTPIVSLFSKQQNW